MSRSRTPTNLQATLPAASKPDGLAWLSSPWVASMVLLAVAIVARLPGLDQLPRFDELYTLPAAQNMMSEGAPRIANGVYSRAVVYTMLLGGWFKVAGDSLLMARVPSVLFGSLLVVAVFLWTNAVTSRAAAWISGLFVALSPLGIEMSQYARFYALHALVFWLAAIGVYALATQRFDSTARQIVIGVGTLLCLLLAVLLQVLTLVGSVGLAVWLAGTLLQAAFARGYHRSRWFWPALGGLMLAVLLIIAVALTTPVVRGLLHTYMSVPLTVIQHEGQIWYYHLNLIERYPTLWPVFPLLAAFAVAAYPKPSLFALCVFGVAFVIMSFGGRKSLHLLFFATPFLFVIWGIALVSVWRALRAPVLAAIDRVVAPVYPGMRPLARWGLLIGSLAFLVLANGAPARTLLIPLGLRLEGGYSAAWPEAVPELEPWVRSADVVLTSHELHMLYYLDRADIVVSKERLAEFADTEFAIDPRTGLPVVSEAQSLELIFSCYPDGVIVTDTLKGWRAPTVIDEGASDFIAAHTEPIDLPEGFRIRAFRWQTPTADEPPAACAAIPGYRDADAAS